METFTYSELPERHIRLLSINPHTTPPSGTLDTVSLDDNLDFDALSYAWGSSGDTLDFHCSGKVLCVHENLADFLRLASVRCYQKPLWIDAICIDQEVVSEKNHQIPLMGEVYSKAAQVLVWFRPKFERRRRDVRFHSDHCGSHTECTF